MEIFISVVVPVYKVENYLDRCIKSLLNQIYNNFEIILIDDGSPDQCPIMCDRYSKIYSNIRVIHKENGGLSDARNIGTKEARGNFITYVDSDDFVPDNYLKVLVDGIIKYHADISVARIKQFYSMDSKQFKNKRKHDIVLGKKSALVDMLYQNKLDTTACGILLPARLAKSIPFPYGKYHEDELTTYKYYTSVKKIVIMGNTSYYYFQRNESIMHMFGQASIDELDAADNLVEVCKEKWPFAVKAAKSKKFSDYCQVFLSCNDIEIQYPEIYKRIEYYLSKEKKNILLDKQTRMKNKIAAIALFYGTNGLKKLNKLCWKR